MIYHTVSVLLGMFLQVWTHRVKVLGVEVDDFARADQAGQTEDRGGEGECEPHTTSLLSG